MRVAQDLVEPEATTPPFGRSAEMPQKLVVAIRVHVEAARNTRSAMGPNDEHEIF